MDNFMMLEDLGKAKTALFCALDMGDREDIVQEILDLMKIAVDYVIKVSDKLEDENV